MTNSGSQESLGAVAVIGMTGRFPKAKNLTEFWKNLCDGLEAISFFTDDELLAEGANPDLLKAPNCVKAGGMVENVDLFDAEFFGFNPREAEITDPQHRIFLECSWEALEDAGYDPERFAGRISMYSGMGASEYYAQVPRHVRAVTDGLTLAIGNEKDFVATRVSYKINLKGPSMTVQTACSTSLVTVCLACQSLLNYQADMALAGGVSLDLRKQARLYTEGGILSPDGHCRAFDAKAKGTIWGSGVGVVVLRRLEDAIADGDRIYAVIKASSMNNDGSSKIGYTAPSVDGQAAVIAEATALAGINPETISYIETHGTATPLGDPIEVAALTRAFRMHTQRKGFCRIGSVKTNIGHTDAAAGIAGFIKTALALKHKQIPASLNYEKPNPQIDFESSPFFVNTKLVEWQKNGTPRRAGVSSFGIGGTNAHVILEEAPDVPESGPSRPWQLLTVSARSAAALEAATANLSEHFKKNPDTKLADAAFTLQAGRKAFEYRRGVLCRSVEDAIAALENSAQASAGPAATETRHTVFMFPGQGSQYVNMGKELYEREVTFRNEVDRCSTILQPDLGLDLRDVLFATADRLEEATELLTQTRITQPALFVMEYALARLWMEWGIRPESMIGHSIGEYVAALLAGVFSLEHGLKLVAARGRLIQEMAPGSMLTVALSEKEVLPLLGDSLSLAAVNAPSLCTISGPTEAVNKLEAVLAKQGVYARKLQTSHAFHSSMMDAALEDFRQALQGIHFKQPMIPYLSNVTGTWITSEVTNPDYWIRHLRREVRFSDGVRELLKGGPRTFLEVGPGKTLRTLVEQHLDSSSNHLLAGSMRHPNEDCSDQEFVLTALGRIWAAGVNVDWNGFYRQERRRRVSLPVYPFERKRYWAGGGEVPEEQAELAVFKGKKKDIADWFYVPSWKRIPVSGAQVEPGALWLVFADECGLAAAFTAGLRERGEEFATILSGERFAHNHEKNYTIDPGNPDDYLLLLKAIEKTNRRIRIAYMWPVSNDEVPARTSQFEKQKGLAFYGPLYLAKAIGSRGIKDPVEIMLVSTGAHAVLGDEQLSIGKAMLLGPCRVIPQEYTNVRCTSVDLPARLLPESIVDMAAQLIRETDVAMADAVVAYRGKHRWVQTFEAMRVEGAAGVPARLKEKGVYLITGGAGGIGLKLAEYLARETRARLALIGRSRLPEKENWQAWIDAHDSSDEISGRLRALQAMEKAGAELLYFAADVADSGQMQDVVEQIHRRFGGINGVIHSAGVPAGGLIQLKTREMAEPIFASKTTGTLVLDSLIDNEKLDFFLLCSSVASILGSAGQVDYTAANAFLDAFAQARTGKNGCSVVSINWDAWNEVGMAVKARDLWPMLPDGTVDMEKLRHASTYEPCDHPLLGRAKIENQQATFLAEFSVAKNWVLSEHLVMGNPTLVGTAYLELARAAFHRFSGTSSVVISDVVFISPLVVPEGEKREVQTHLNGTAGGVCEFVVSSRPAGSETWQQHAIGRVSSLGRNEDRETLSLDRLKQRCAFQEYGVAEYKEAINAPGERADKRLTLDYGPRWENVKKIHMGEDEVLIRLELAEEYAGDLENYLLHPALLDKATSLAAFQLCSNSDFLPFSYQTLKLYAPLQRRIYSYGRAKANGQSDEVLTFDITILDEDGKKLAEIENFTIRKLNERALEALGSQHQEKEHAQTPSGVLKPVADDLADAIRPDEGVEVFRRILGANCPSQLVVSARDLRHRMALVQTSDAGKDKSQPETKMKPRHPRPALKTPYAAPENDLEQSIADIWQMVLGIEQVGTNDNFIELGGHSLLAIQVISRLREALQVDLAMDSIFKNPTVAALANQVVAMFAEQADSETLSAMLAEIEGMSAQ